MRLSHIEKATFLIFGLLLGFSGCSSKPIIPDSDKVEVSREPADKDCRDLGVVYGKTLSTTGELEKLALEDLKKNAAQKGANYVHLGEYSGLGSSVKGQAYLCD